MKDNSVAGCITCFLAISCIAFACFAVSWLKAGMQRAVYEREGIYMTTSEVFMGARPAERAITIKSER